MSKPVYTLEQAADYLAVSKNTVRRWISDGKLRAYRYGGQRIIRIDHADLMKLRRPVTTLEAVGK